MSVRILHGDCREILKTLEPESVDCVVTSPPYWGLRDYGVDGQLGLEPTLGEHIETMVDVFREVHRVLKKTGTVWLNYGDCYATAPNGWSAAKYKEAGTDDRTHRDKPFSTIGPIYSANHEAGDRRGGRCKQRTHDTGEQANTGRIVAGGMLKPKDLCMVPNRIAIALQEDGWWVRSEIIWGKRNPMPESIKDRPATAHEKIWLLTKSARYFYDPDAVRMEAAPASLERWEQDIDSQDGSPRANGGTRANRAMKAVGGPRLKEKQAATAASAGADDNHTGIEAVPRGEGRNLRNYEPAPVEVWDMATRPFPDAHFATFPLELAERCIKAGCPAGGTVLDPFGGAGTTGVVADRLQRNGVLIELNADYIKLARDRLANDRGALLDWIAQNEAEAGAAA